jgi:hypothetical protein
MLLIIFISLESNAKGLKHLDAGIDLTPAVYSPSEKFTLSYSAGVTVDLTFGKKSGLTTGLQFTNIRSQGSVEYIRPYPRDFSTTLTIYYTDSTVEKYQGSTASRYIDLPLIFSYRITTKKFIYSVNTGVIFSCHINTRNSATYYHFDGHESYWLNSSGNYRGFGILFSPCLNLAIEKEIADDIFLKAGPSVRVNDINDHLLNFEIEKVLYGINFSAMKRFK